MKSGKIHCGDRYSIKLGLNLVLDEILDDQIINNDDENLIEFKLDFNFASQFKFLSINFDLILEEFESLPPLLHFFSSSIEIGTI